MMIFQRLLLLSFTFIIILLHCSLAANYEFKFDTSSKSGNKFTNGDANITISDTTAYVEVKPISSGANIRGASGYIQLDYTNDVLFDKVLDYTSNASPWKYFIGGVFHFRHNSYSNDCLFCVKIVSAHISSGYLDAYWCITISASSPNTIVYSTLYNNTYSERKQLNLSFVISGWEYLGFSFINTVGGNAVYLKSANSGSYVTRQFDDTTLTTGSGLSISSGSIGCIYTSPKQSIFAGVIAYFHICPDDTTCSPYLTNKSTLLSFYTNLYEHYWDLTQNNYFDGSTVSNNCIRDQEVGNSSPTKFISDQGGVTSYPTKIGWFTLLDKNWIYSMPISLDGSHQMTFQFEIFPIDPQFSFNFYPYEVTDKSNRMSIQFAFNCTNLSNPNFNSASYMIKPQQWNRIFVTISRLEDQNDMEISVYISTIIPYSATSQTVSIVRYSNIYLAQYELKSSTIKIAFYNSKAIFKNVKFYKYSFITDTIKDLGQYKNSDDSDYNFMQNFESNYYSGFSNNVAISNQNNLCMASTSPESNVCMDLSSAGNPTCPIGYIQQLYFCMDSCGDGNLQLNPQIYQCDDGNTKDGDGCNHSCMVESGYTCTTTSIRNLHGEIEGRHRRLSSVYRSNCVKTCGNGIINTANSEVCDDGNTNDGDGCSSSCTIESGYKCRTNVSPTFCYPNCGDGIKDTTPLVEECDDGNNFSNDGCSKDCKIETNYQCTQGSNGADICTTKYSSPTIVKNRQVLNLNKLKISYYYTLI